MKLWHSVFLLFCGCFVSGLLVGCAKPDPTIILGKWRAESFKVDSLLLPIAPSFEVTRNELVLMTPNGEAPRKLPLSAIRAKEQSIELEFRDGYGVGIQFIVESKDRVHFIVPLASFDIVYNRQ
jgi:hypothetical protein